MSLHLVHCQPDPVKLAAWATRHKLLSSDGDYGYALHALLTAAFGDRAPKPFCYLGVRQGLLGYAGHDAAALQEHAALATPDVAGALGLEGLQVRPFPTTWRSGQRLGFEVRIRPVMRSDDGRERDAYLKALEAVPQEVGVSRPQRESVYAQWLRQRMESDNAVQIIHLGMEGFRLTRVIRRGRGKANGEERQRHSITGPVALFRGELQVSDSTGFGRLVARGIGRHRSFGFGMLLLKPARSC